MSFLAEHGRLGAYLTQAFQSVVLLVIVTAVFAPLEHLFGVRRERFFHGGWKTNLAWYGLGSLTPIVILGPLSALLTALVHAIVPAGVQDAVNAVPLGWRMVLAMIVGEFGFYWGHRWSHEWRWLWRFHAVHHSAEHISFLVNTRAHPVDAVFTRLCGLTLLYVTGLASPVGPHPTLVPALVLFVGSLWSYFIHANIRWRLGPLEHLVSSPAFHHWHHTREDHKDHNFASMLPIYDHLFGTFYSPRDWPVEYGTDTPMPNDVLGQLIEPFAPARLSSPPPFERALSDQMRHPLGRAGRS